ncbi:SDR family NAD(P)-dependent oxidoreductase [Lutimaribacter marinistellae]|uniref:SDR family NAD(P)-dependent oxidoreductase n=1 Tax=Lutimaribacter marinistellae TaxID=1820329 RepID=A0ABV7TBZ6_9RHOB
MESQRLKGKTAYVTGAGRGIGRAVALKLAREGANVVINDLDGEPANEVAGAISGLGGTALPVIGSVTEEGFADHFIQQGLDAFGEIDIVVNNAGYTWDTYLAKMSDAQFDAMMDVHVKAPFRVLRAAAPHIRKRAEAEAARGEEVFRKVVNVSSIAGLGGNPGQANYAAGKAAVIGLTKTLAKEWGRHKVNVNCAAFGYIETRLTEAREVKEQVVVDGNAIGVGIPKAAAEAFGSQVPLGRGGTPEEAADGVYLLCAPEANYVSGQVLVIGGGLLI